MLPLRTPWTRVKIRLSPCIPIDQKGDVSSPFMDFPSTKRAFHSPLEPSSKERIAALWKPEPTLRGLDAVSVSLLNLDHFA